MGAKKIAGCRKGFLSFTDFNSLCLPRCVVAPPPLLRSNPPHPTAPHAVRRLWRKDSVTKHAQPSALTYMHVCPLTSSSTNQRQQTQTQRGGCCSDTLLQCPQCQRKSEGCPGMYASDPKLYVCCPSNKKKQQPRTEALNAPHHHQ